MSPALQVEWWKLKRSPVTVTATALMVALLPALGLAFFSVAQRGGTGPIAQKAGAMLVGEGWEGYLGAINQIAATAMFLGAGIVAAWVFGREHADRTFASLFALPVSRGAVARSKFTVLLAWVVALSVMVVVVAAVLGWAAGVGEIEAATTGAGLLRLLVIALSTSLLGLTTALIASVGRGYLPAIGALLLVIVAAQVAVLFGTGGWFPFAVPGLLAIAGSDGAPTLTAAQFTLVPVTTAIVMWATVRWWERAEAV